VEAVNYNKLRANTAYGWSYCSDIGTIIQCVRKVAVHLYKMMEMMSTSVYTGQNPVNFILKHFLQICVRKVSVHL
jgi:hypothetical protein